MNHTAPPAPDWQVTQWFNTRQSPALGDFRGKPVVLIAFQMLCPACVSHSLPLAQRIHATFPPDRLAVIGLHTVFEHHEAMTPLALQAFIHEYRIPFPVGVDRPGDDDPIPKTMRAYGMRGTPTLCLIDGHGRLRQQLFGQLNELALGASIATLMNETD